MVLLLYVEYLLQCAFILQVVTFVAEFLANHALLIGVLLSVSYASYFCLKKEVIAFAHNLMAESDQAI